MESGRQKTWGKDGGREGNRSRVEREKEMASQGIRDGGEEGGRREGGEGGKVWKLADRIGYAQTESQAQAQTWEPYVNLRNASPISLPHPLLLKRKKKKPSQFLPSQSDTPQPYSRAELLPFFSPQTSKHTKSNWTAVVPLSTYDRIQGVDRASK